MAECKNVVQNISKGLNTETNKSNSKISLHKISYSNSNSNNDNKSKNINEMLKQSIQKENLVTIYNLKDKKLPNKLFKQYFINISKFSKTIIDYGLNGNDDEKSNE